MTSLLREACARANDFFLEPVPAAAGNRNGLSQTEVAVLGLSAGCGVTTLARGLALSRSPAALVRDIAAGEAESARAAAHRADAVVLVAGPGSEPSLAELVAQMICHDLGRIVLVANRVTDPSRWNGRADLLVPESRLGAALVSRGRRPVGAFAAALAKLGEIVEEPRN